MMQPFSNGTEYMDYYSHNCSGCDREFPYTGKGSCDLAAALASGELTQEQLDRIGGEKRVCVTDGCKGYMILVDCRERPNPRREEDVRSREIVKVVLK